VFFAQIGKSIAKNTSDVTNPTWNVLDWGRNRTLSVSETKFAEWWIGKEFARKLS
jgi:hypothetical protein